MPIMHTTINIFGRVGRAALVAAALFVGTYAARGQSQHAGALGSKDDTLTSGEYTDSYTVFADVGEWIHVVMTSPEIDPYVILKPPSCPIAGTCEQQRDNRLVEGGVNVHQRPRFSVPDFPRPRFSRAALSSLRSLACAG